MKGVLQGLIIDLAVGQVVDIFPASGVNIKSDHSEFTMLMSRTSKEQARLVVLPSDIVEGI
jgi:hypothetical protein